MPLKGKDYKSSEQAAKAAMKIASSGKKIPLSEKSEARKMSKKSPKIEKDQD
jgi:hypothetical protein